MAEASSSSFVIANPPVGPCTQYLRHHVETTRVARRTDTLAVGICIVDGGIKRYILRYLLVDTEFTRCLVKSAVAEAYHSRHSATVRSSISYFHYLPIPIGYDPATM